MDAPTPTPKPEPANQPAPSTSASIPATPTTNPTQTLTPTPPTTPSPAPRPTLPEQDAQLYLHPQTLARLGTLELRAKMIVEGVMSGQHRSPYHGFSVEFAQHRPYTAGDDIRHLDWKVFGRTNKLHLKQYQQETNLDLAVLVDASGSMRYGSRLFSEASGTGAPTNPRGNVMWSKYDHATAVAAACSYMALRQGDRVGLTVFADSVLAQVKRSSATRQWRQIVGAMATHPVERETDLARVIDQVLGNLTNRCLVVLISDLYIDPETYRTALARIRHRRHDLIVFQVIDPAEREFDLTEIAPFDGLEGEPRLRVDPRAIRQAYQQVYREHAAKIEKTTRSMGFDFSVVDTHSWLGPPMAAFMARRASLMKRLKIG